MLGVIGIIKCDGQWITKDCRSFPEQYTMFFSFSTAFLPSHSKFIIARL
jgi:hypothetical protein